jgi:SAM-dependent methyltransferase
MILINDQRHVEKRARRIDRSLMMPGLKQQVIRALRAAGLLETAEEARYLAIRARYALENRRLRRARPDSPLPPSRLLYEISSGVSYEAYLASGRESAERVWSFVPPLLKPEIHVICEWGCGIGRVIRHTFELPGASFTRVIGTDYDERMIRWCAANLKGIEFFKNDVHPPLPLGDSSIDCVYALSVLTHLDEALQREWIEELFRVIRPGGIMVLTTHGEGVKDRLSEDEREAYERGEMVIRSSTRVGGRLYASYASPALMRRLLDRGKVVRYEPGAFGTQDVWVVERPGGVARMFSCAKPDGEPDYLRAVAPQV